MTRATHIQRVYDQETRGRWAAGLAAGFFAAGFFAADFFAAGFGARARSCGGGRQQR